MTIDNLQPSTVWKNLTREQFIIITYVNINTNKVNYIDKSDNKNNPRVHEKTIDHLLRLYKFITTIDK